MAFTLWGQYEIGENYQAVFWYVFFVDGLAGDSRSIIDEFLHNGYFSNACLPFVVKKDYENASRFLDKAFNSAEFELSKFKTFSKEELIFFFKDYAETGDFRSDKDEFISLFNRFNTFLSKEPAGPYFLISKEWFSKGDAILTTDSEVYSYYIVVIWYDEKHKHLNVCEWTYD